VLGSPFDVGQVPIVAPLRPLLSLTDGYGPLTWVYQAAGAVPRPLVRWAVQLSAVQKLVTKPLAVVRHLDDADYLAQLEAVDRFRDHMVAYPGRTFGQLYHRLLKGKALDEGAFDLEGRTISIADVTAPVLVFAGAEDGIAPAGSVKALVPFLVGSSDVRFEIVPGGHLGILTGRRARTATWPVIDAWLAEWSRFGAEPAPAATAAAKAAPRRTTKKASKKASKKAAKKASRKPSPATKAAASPAQMPAQKSAEKPVEAPAKPAEEAPPEEHADEPSIGVNPHRRYGSAGSRALRR